MEFLSNGHDYFVDKFLAQSGVFFFLVYTWKRRVMHTHINKVHSYLVVKMKLKHFWLITYQFIFDWLHIKTNFSDLYKQNIQQKQFCYILWICKSITTKSVKYNFHICMYFINWLLKVNVCDHKLWINSL